MDFSTDFEFSLMLDDDGDTRTKPQAPPLATHCNVPLKYNKQRAAILKPSFGQYINPRNLYRKEYLSLIALYGDFIPTYYDICHCQHGLLNNFIPPPNTIAMAEWTQQNRVSSCLWREQSMAVQSMIAQGFLFPDYHLTAQQIDILMPYYFRKAFFEEAILSSGSKSFTPTLWWRKDDDITYYRDFDLFIAVSPNLAIIAFQLNCYLISRDHLLILSDLAAQRYQLVKYSILSTFHPQTPFLPTGILIEFFEQGDLILRRGGNEAYQIISSIEPLCLSHLVGDLPVGSRLGKTFKELITSEVLENAASLFILDETKGLLSLIDIAGSTSPSYITELYGLYRIWGHPTVEPLEGAVALKKIVSVVRITDQELVNAITNKFKEEFICRYISKEHMWPDLNMDLLPDSNIIKQAYNQKSSFPNKHKEYNRSHLSLVSFKQLFPVDPKFDLIELIADKALSLITPELIASIINNNNCGTAIQRSVLLNWLKSPIQDPEKFLYHIDMYGFPEFEQTDGLREKEREAKLKARMFGLMTLFKRMYIVLTEALLAEHLIPYFPEITMIDDELSLDKKRHTFNLRPQNIDQIIVSLDFSKWNSNMRRNETLALFKCFDQMFGFTNCFTRTHEMFETSSIYLLNGTYLPRVDYTGKLIQDLGCWNGHLGGIEGLRQKGWTLWTVALILLASENCNFNVMLMGQGDNQILRLRYPLGLSPEQAEEVMYDFLKNLNLILSKIGPPLKLEETWASRDLYVYGKYIIYKGIPMPTSGKRIARIFRLSNEDYPTLESALSSATANLTSAISCHYIIGPLFALYLSEVIATFQLAFRTSYLQPKPFNEVFSTMTTVRIPGNPSINRDLNGVLKHQPIQSDYLYEALCLFPRALGGFPILNLFDCMIRGFPDEVSFAIASLKKIYNYVPPILKTIVRRICSPPINSQRNFKLIIEHPTVLNLEIPPAPGESRRNLIINFLQTGDIPLNQYIQTFLNLLESSEEDEFIKYLETIKPFNPRILALFAGATAESRARHVAGKLQKTKTIATVARESSSVDLYSKIIDAEKNHMGSVLRLVTQDHVNTILWNPDKCSIKHSDELRQASWGTSVIGVNCVPPQEFIKLEPNLSLHKCHSEFELDKGYVVLRFDPSYGLRSFQSPLVMGLYPPYRGSVTRQKVSGYGDKIAAQAEPILQKVLRLFSLVGWGIPRNGCLHTLCNLLLHRHTDLPSEELCPPDEEISGSVHHRLQDMRTGHGGSVPVLPNYGSKIMFDTFPLTAYSKGSKNVNLMFQSFMSMGVVLLGEMMAQGWKPNMPTSHLHVLSSCCVQEVTDEMSEAPFPPSFSFQIQEENPYLYVKKEKIMLLMEKGLRFSINRDLGPDPESLFHRYHSVLGEECFHLLSPHSWDRATYHFKTQQLVINWVLICHSEVLFHTLALRLCAHFTGAIRENNVSKFLLRVGERVERSPVDSWKNLVALIFAPNIQHHIVGPGVLGRVSGNPICGDTTLAVMIKESVVTIINTWANDPISRQSLHHVDCYGRPYCGLSQHPSLLLLTKDWILNQFSSSIFMPSRYGIINRLTNNVRGYESSMVVTLADHYLMLGKLRITGETLDYLCKRDIPIPMLTTIPRFGNPQKLPKGGESVLTFNRNHTINTFHSIHHEIVYTKSISYVNNLLKIVATPTTGTYKCLTLLRELNIMEPKSIACLGDGAGGFTLGCLLYYPEAKVFFNTLIEKEIPIQQSSPIPYIPSLAGYPDLEKRVIGLNTTTDIVSDLTNSSFPMIVQERVSKQFDLLMCDAEVTKESATLVGINLIHSIITFSRMLQVKTCIFKTYLKNVSLVSLQISVLLTYFSEVVVFRSHFSSVYNTEVYLIATKPELVETSLITKDYETWSGPLLKPVFIEKLYEWRDYLVSSYKSNIRNISSQYTNIISQGKEYSIIIELRKTLIFVQPDNSYIYPLDVVKWIIDTSSKETGAPQPIRVRLETYTLHFTFLKRWAMALLISFCLTNIEKHLSNLSHYINYGSLIWYRLNNKRWDISLFFSPVPDFSKTLGVKTFPLQDLIKETDIKLIYRLIGIALHLNIKFSNINRVSPLEIRGSFNLSQRPILEPECAEHEWIQANIQFGIESLALENASSSSPLL